MFELEDGTFAVSGTAVGVLPTKVMGHSRRRQPVDCEPQSDGEDRQRQHSGRSVKGRPAYRGSPYEPLIQKLLAAGHDTTDAEALYRTMRGALEYFEVGRRKIEDELF
jgi:hypothetical protein